MNPEIKAQWLAALRSGNYIQGKYYLQSFDVTGEQHTFCCLGVLCDIMGKENWKQDDTAILEYVYEDAKSSTRLPCTLYPQIRLELHHQRVLSQINDKSKDFTASIRYIEEHL